MASYCHVSAGGGRCLVPFGLIGQNVWAVADERTVEVVHDGAHVTSHVRLAEGEWSTRREHTPPGHASHREMNAERLRPDAGKVNEGAVSLAAVLLGEGADTEQTQRSCCRLLRLEGIYGRERLDAACARAVSTGNPRVSSVESILRNRLDQRAA